VLQYLLENAKMDLEATDDGGKTALYWAVGYDRLDCYKLLVQHGAKVDIKDNVRRNHATPNGAGASKR
jgi:ankyrin repeat protein